MKVARLMWNVKGDGHDRLFQWLTGDSLNQERDRFGGTAGECRKGDEDESDRDRQRMEPTDRSPPRHDRILAGVPRDVDVAPDAARLRRRSFSGPS